MVFSSRLCDHRMKKLFEVIRSAQCSRDPNPSTGQGKNRQDRKRNPHDRRRLVRFAMMIIVSAVRSVIMLMIMPKAFFAAEREVHHAGHINGGQQRRKGGDDPEDLPEISRQDCRGIGLPENFVLAEKTR